VSEDERKIIDTIIEECERVLAGRNATHVMHALAEMLAIGIVHNTKEGYSVEAIDYCISQTRQVIEAEASKYVVLH